MTLTYISCSSDFYTFYVDVPISLGCLIRKVSAEDIGIRGNGTGLEYMCPTRHFVLIFFNTVFKISTAKNEINLFNNHILIVAPVTFAPAGAMSPSAEFLCLIYLNIFWCMSVIFSDTETVWPKLWPQNKYVSMTYISWSSDFAWYLLDYLMGKCHNWYNGSVWHEIDLIKYILVNDLYVMVQWFCFISWDKGSVLL